MYDPSPFLIRSSYKECTINDSSVVCVAWHQEFNQIVAGCQTGEAVGYYAPQMSKKGFLRPTSRKVCSPRLSRWLGHHRHSHAILR